MSGNNSETFDGDAEVINVDVGGDLIIESGANVNKIVVNQSEDVDCTDSDVSVKEGQDVVVRGDSTADIDSVKGDVNH